MCALGKVELVQKPNGHDHVINELMHDELVHMRMCRSAQGRIFHVVTLLPRFRTCGKLCPEQIGYAVDLFNASHYETSASLVNLADVTEAMGGLLAMRSCRGVPSPMQSGMNVGWV